MPVERNIARSGDVLMNRIEMLIAAALDYVDKSTIHRLPELVATVCNMFNADGCVIAYVPVGVSKRHRVLISHARSGRQHTDLIENLVLQESRSQEFRLLNSESGVGPTIVVHAAIGQMLIYRHDRLRSFSEEDARLIGALWRCCGNSEKKETNSTPNTQIDECSFSPRVQQVLTCLLEGLAEKQIAARLCMSPHTVHIHVKKLYRQLKVNSRSQLLVQCLNQGLFAQKSSTSVARRRRNLLNMEIKSGEIKPGNEVIAAALPISTVDGTGANMLFS